MTKRNNTFDTALSISIIIKDPRAHLAHGLSGLVGGQGSNPKRSASSTSAANSANSYSTLWATMEVTICTLLLNSLIIFVYLAYKILVKIVNNWNYSYQKIKANREYETLWSLFLGSPTYISMMCPAFDYAIDRICDKSNSNNQTSDCLFHHGTPFELSFGPN